jgi:hypothetical protein
MSWINADVTMKRWHLLLILGVLISGILRSDIVALAWRMVPKF